MSTDTLEAEATPQQFTDAEGLTASHHLYDIEDAYEHLALQRQEGRDQRNAVIDKRKVIREAGQWTAENIDDLSDQEINDILEAVRVDFHVIAEEDREVLLPMMPRANTATQDVVHRSASSWQPIDLHTAQTEPERPVILTRTDGVPLLYAGRINWLSGEPEAGKSWLAYLAMKETLDSGRRVLVIDAEDGPSGFAGRSEALSVNALEAHDTQRLRYINPHETTRAPTSFAPIPAAQIDMREQVNWGADLVILDACTALMSLESLDPLSNKDVATWLAEVVKPFARAGSAVLVIDHVTKSREGRDRWAIGSQHKLAAVDGAAFMIEAMKPVGRAVGLEPVYGLSRLTLTKDRVGFLRGHAQGEKVAPIADVSLSAYPDGGMTIKLEAPGLARTDTHQAVIVAHLAVYDGATKTSLRSLGFSEGIDAATAALISAGHVKVVAKGNSHQHSLTTAGRSHWANQIAAATGGEE